jgi:predicted nicotinamide N-methyase
MMPADRALAFHDCEAFIRANTSLIRPPHLPEIQLHLADEAHDLWLRTEEELEAIGLPPPFWAFAWAGGQALGRYVLDNPSTVAGKRVLDFATGSGVVAIAAAMAGAADTTAADLDPFCEAAVRINAALNGVSVVTTMTDRVGEAGAWDVVLAGDVFYDRAFAERLMPWFTELHARGTDILIGDPGRAYLPPSGLHPLATYEVAVSRSLEDAEVKKTTVWRFTAGS